jgi:hypothetical protein
LAPFVQNRELFDQSTRGVVIFADSILFEREVHHVAESLSGQTAFSVYSPIRCQRCHGARRRGPTQAVCCGLSTVLHSLDRRAGRFQGRFLERGLDARYGIEAGIADSGLSQSPLNTVADTYNQDGTKNDGGHAAMLGSTITLFATAMGETDPPVDPGSIAHSDSVTPVIPV